MDNKKIALILLVLLAVPLVSAGLFDWMKTMTGKASSQLVNVSISVSGINPVTIPYISACGQSAASTESSATAVPFSVWVRDSDGNSDINKSSVQVNFTKSGEPFRLNLSCAYVNLVDSNTLNFSCYVYMTYWDSIGNWTVTASATDYGNLSRFHNNSCLFAYTVTKAMLISPNGLTWPAITPGGKNSTSDNDTLVVNNTGNYEGNITLSAIDLRGNIDSSQMINAVNFTAGNETSNDSPTNATECGTLSTRLVNNTDGTTTRSILNTASNRGNLSTAGAPGFTTGQEQLYFCIGLVPSLQSQIYSTANSTSWTVSY
jgi:hypothetical protein